MLKSPSPCLPGHGWTQGSSLAGLVGLIVLALGGCMLGGGGSDTEISGAMVSGKIRTLDGIQAARAQVWLIPANFRPGTDADTRVHTELTDVQGVYRFKGIDSGTFNLEAQEPGGVTRLAKRGIKVKGDIQILDEALRAPGSVFFRLPDSMSSMGGRVYIRGSLRSWHTLPGQNRLLLD